MDTQYQKYFNNNFNFNNEVMNEKMSGSCLQMKCENNIMLEPRLQEYIKKKKTYKKSGFVPCISLEKQYQITEMDIKVMKAFLKGNKQIYGKYFITDNIERAKDFDEENKNFFPSRHFEKDPRVPDIKKPCYDKPVNMGMFADENTGSPYFLNETIQNKKSLDRYQAKHPDYNKGYLMSDLSDTNSLDQFYKDITITHTKPKTNKRSLDTSHYNFDTQFDPVLSRNVKMENELMLGTPTYPRNRSYGYRNPQENYFNYLEEEPHAVNYVEPWTRGGEVTRLDNKKMAHERDIF